MLLLWSQLLKSLPMKMGKRISNEVLGAWDVPRRRRKAVAGSRQKQRVQESHHGRGPSSLGVQHVDHGLIVRTEQNMLSAQLSTLYMSCYHQRKKFLIGNGLGKQGSYPPPSEPETFEIGPNAE